ncbi:MAG TPA: hypothetical protein VN213_14315 [Solirubrobacteraceae bacterium]|nr:hypothetical protein [Solirubrobacteraceae bacterium]
MAGSADDRIVVRKVTDVHANWSEHESDTPGKFSFQLILDDGAEEQVVRPSPEAAKVLLKLLTSGDEVFFDTERRALAVRDVD